MRKDLEELERPPAQAVGVELVWLPGTGGAETLISPINNFGRPHFVNGDTVRVYFSEGSSARLDALGRHRSEDDSAHGRRRRSAAAVAAVAAVK